MEYHSPIRIYRNPLIWIKEKYHSGLNRRDLVCVGMIPALSTAIAFIADSMAVLGIKPEVPFETSFITLLWMLFSFAVLNLIFVLLLQRDGIRLQRERES